MKIESSIQHEAYKGGKFDLDNIHGLKEDVSFSAVGFYATSKLYNIMSTQALASRLAKYNIGISATHPGFVSSDICT